MEVFHNTIVSIIGAIGEVEGDIDKNPTSVFKAIRAVDFDTTWKLAEKLLNQCIVDGNEITDINKTDYFTDHPDEFYLAVGHALMLNYPDVFQRARKVIKTAIQAFVAKHGSNLPGVPAEKESDSPKTV